MAPVPQHVGRALGAHANGYCTTIAAVSICSNVRVKKPDLLDQLVGAGAQHRGNGDAERSTNLIRTGSLPAMKTMGIVVVAAFAAISSVANALRLAMPPHRRGA